MDKLHFPKIYSLSYCILYKKVYHISKSYKAYELVTLRKVRKPL